MTAESEAPVNTETRCSASSKSCTLHPDPRNQASVCQPAGKLSSAVVEEYGSRQTEADEDIPFAARSGPDTSRPPEAERRFHILLAEDNGGDVLLVQHALEYAGLVVHLEVRSDGEEMLKTVESMDAGDFPCPDLVLLDLNLPRMNGFVILARIREGAVCGQVPVVIVTSSDAPTDRKAAERLGASEYFRKPSDYDEFMRLGAVVERFLRR